jgi:hypothetical protein
MSELIGAILLSIAFYITYRIARLETYKKR